MKKLRTVLAACAVIATPLCPAHSQTADEPRQALSFALMGDQPYNDFFEPATDSLIQHINNDPEISWILHVGDIKGGAEPCTDELLIKRISQLQKSEKALVYVPGDNEWTDCHRDSNGNYNSQERLQFLRQQAFSEPQSLGKKHFPVRQQTNHPYPEHLMWLQGSTLFISLNVPGSNNDLHNPASRKTSDREAMQRLREREIAIGDWLAQAAQLFQSNKLPLTETVVTIQGNPIDGSGGESTDDRRNGYVGFMKYLVSYINNTNRPVLLAHGDTHRFKWDKPSLAKFGATSRTDELFYRVEGWGHPFMNAWVKIRITAGAEAPFKVESLTIN